MDATPSAGSLTFLGGAGTVTGSKYLVQTDRAKVLVDCGMFQGRRELRLRNWEPLPLDAAAVDGVLLTHAHLDHCGYLPRLAADGFAGPVYATPETIRLAEIILRDSAHLQEEEAENANRHGWSRHSPAHALYDREDAERPMALAALDVYRDALGAHRRQFLPTVTERGLAELYPPRLRTARSAEESARIDTSHGPQIIISASGMATGGRILYQLASALPDSRNTVLVVGFAAAGTRARDLVEGATHLKIHGRYVPVRAQVVEVSGLSAHADYPEILDWLRAAPKPPNTTYVVHGEPSSAAALRDRLDEQLHWNAVVPRPGERVLIP